MENPSIKERYRLLSPFLDEHLRRRIAAAEALTIGYGGVSVVSRETGLSRGAIALGCHELRHPDKVDKTRIRRRGGGRKQAIVKDPTLKTDLESMLLPRERNNALISWTCLSVRAIATELNAMNHTISHNRIADLLHEMGYTLRANQPSLPAVSIEERDGQFELIDKVARLQLLDAEPVLFLDVRKRELVNSVRPREKRLDERDRLMQNVLHEEYGYPGGEESEDDSSNISWNTVLADVETIRFSCEAISRWWADNGQSRYGKPRQVYLVIDSGSSNQELSELWRHELQHLAALLNLSFLVSHIPPGTSRWHQLEHQIFAFSSQSPLNGPPFSYRISGSLVQGHGEEDDSGEELLDPRAPILQSNTDRCGVWNYLIESAASPLGE